jgi:hypothetical protein
LKYPVARSLIFSEVCCNFPAYIWNQN